MSTPPDKQPNAGQLLREIGKITGVEGEITEDELRARVKLDRDIIPNEFLATGPKGEECFLFNSWIGLFATNPVLAFGMHPDAIDYIDWGNKNRRNRVRRLFVKAKKISVRPRDRYSLAPPEGSHFVELLQYLINKSGLFDHEAATMLNITNMTLSRYFTGKLPISQERIEAIISSLEADYAGEKRVSAYSEYRDQIRGFLLPEPPEGCSFGSLLKHVILRSGLSHGTAARHFELTRGSLTHILNKSVTKNRMRNIVSILEIDHGGSKIFAAYGQYRERFQGFLPTAETFEQLVGCVVAESSVSVAAAARFFRISYEGFKRNLAGENMRPLTKQIVYDHLEKDFRGDRVFLAFEKYRGHIRALMKNNTPDNEFYIVLRKTISESHRSIVFAANRFGMSASTLTVNLRGIKGITRESGQAILAALEADSIGPNEFAAYPKNREKLRTLVTRLRTYSEMRYEAARNRMAKVSAKKADSQPSP